MSINRNMSILATGASSTGGLSNVASIGIGMTPVNVLDITQSTNGASAISLLNSNGGVSARAEIYLNNGTSFSLFRKLGSAFTTSGMLRQDGLAIQENGAGGLTLTTGAAQPIYFGINSTEVARIDTSGNLAIGTTSSTYRLVVLKDSRAAGANYSTSAMQSSAIAWFYGGENDTSKASTILFNQFNSTAAISCGYTSTQAGFLAFGTSNGSSADVIERARIDSSGNLLVGTTSSNPLTVPTTGLAIVSGGIRLSSTNGGSYMAVNATSGTIVNFYTYNGGAVIGGNISQNGGTTAFNTTSDYRLKENVEPLLEGVDTIALLKPVKYNWVRDGLEGKGFIAHELQAVIPLAVTGEKDAMNDDGTILAQGVDFGKIVPHLVAAIQELTTRLAALEAK